MIDIREILNNTQKVKENLAKRGFDLKKIDRIKKLALTKNQYIVEVEQLREQRNKLSKAGPGFENDPANIQKIKDIKKEIEKLEILLTSLNSSLQKLMLSVPNLLEEQVPAGTDENDNVVLEKFANLGRGEFVGKPHYEIANELDLFSQPLGAKLAGARFVVYKDKIAKLIRSLANYFLDFNKSRGYTEMNVPHIVKSDMLVGTGQLPKFKEDLFALEGEEWWLIPTGEIPLTNLFNNEIVDLTKPYCFTTFTKCFRSEAGSGGRNIRGIIRMKEFHKVEVVKITNKESGWEEYQKMLDDVTALLKTLNIPFRKVVLCSGDTGFSSAYTVDFEIWMPSENAYKEISSVSICSDFQARRAKTRYKNSGKTEYATTMNGSALAIDRCVAAIIENYYNEDGTISIPDCLVDYYKSKTL